MKAYWDNVSPPPADYSGAGSFMPPLVSSNCAPLESASPQNHLDAIALVLVALTDGEAVCVQRV
jgi:hypothetical protein